MAHIYRHAKFCGDISIRGRVVTKKINVRHFGFLPPVSILTISPLSASNSASVCQISSKSDHPRRSYDVISILVGAPWQRKSTSGFHFGDLVVFRWPISTRITNFMDIS